ncbi:MAG: glycerate dehydrogenase, partial [Actinomycetota bacterium]|nr:glycerate dehydrogenase [Actinomycetota bacterium]
RVGELGAAWGMRPIGCVDRTSPEYAASLRLKGIELTDLDSVLARSDYVSIHVPLTPSTQHLIDAGAMARMKTGAFLINTARGGIVDESALQKELTKGRLAGAALDVHEREGEGTISSLGHLDNVVLTPHIGGMASDSQRRIGRRVIEIIDSFGEGFLDETLSDGERVV